MIGARGGVLLTIHQGVPRVQMNLAGDFVREVVKYLGTERSSPRDVGLGAKEFDMTKQIAIPKLLLVSVVLAWTSGPAGLSAQSVGGLSVKPPVPQTTVPTPPTEADAHIVGLGAPFITIPGQLAKLGSEARVVEVTRGAGGFGTGPYIAPPESLDETICGTTRISDVVAIVHVTDRQSRLSLGQDWIRSTVTARVLRVLKDDQSRLSDGDTIAFEEEGGEMMIGGRRVFTVDRFSLPTQVDQEYLVFLGRGSDGALTNTWGGGTTFELKNGRVDRRLRLDVRLEGSATTDEVIAKVQAAKMGGQR